MPWKSTTFLTNKMACAKGMIELVKILERVAVKTGTMTCPSAFISLLLHCVTLAIRLVESNNARIWRYHQPKFLNYVDSGMLVNEGQDSFHQMLSHPEIHCTKDIGYAVSRRSKVFNITQDAIRASKRSIFQTLYCFLSFTLNYLSPGHYL